MAYAELKRNDAPDPNLGLAGAAPYYEVRNFFWAGWNLLLPRNFSNPIF